MTQTTRNWLPVYCDPRSLLPTVQETIILFSEPPYLFQDFVGKAITFLKSEAVQKMGFVFNPKTALPCKWKCSDEAVFGVDLCLYAYTGHYPFDKGKIGGCFNEESLGAAVHHSRTNIDFGGSHVGYWPGEGGGTFGYIARPLHEAEISTDCGHLMALMAPFKQVYDDACRNILFFSPEEGRVVVSVPNEFLAPNWSSQNIKLIVDVERLTAGPVPYDVDKPYTHKLAGRSFFYAHPDFLAALPPETAAQFRTRERVPIGQELTADTFSIFDTAAELVDGSPTLRLLPYMKYVLSSKLAPYPLKAAVTNTNIEYSKLTDSVRAEQFRPHAFASFTGVFIDMYDAELSSYVNLFQPIGISIKPAGRSREVEIPPAEVHHIFDRLEPADPVLPLEGVLGYAHPRHVLEKFTFRPGHFLPGRSTQVPAAATRVGMPSSGQTT
jgi:hypothetical protein